MLLDSTLIRTDLDALSDAQLVAATGARLAVPRVAPADSFVLHSALELLARKALLAFVQPSMRPAARDRFVALGDQFEAFDEPLPSPRTLDFDDVAAGARALVDAIARGELDDVDATAAWLGTVATPEQLRLHLADALVPSLAAAGHAPIFLYLLPRVAPRGEATGRLLRQLCRELARQPAWRLTWFERRNLSRSPISGFISVHEHAASARELTEALVATPMLGDPPVAFIHPLMSRIDSDEAAGAWLGATTTGQQIRDRSLALLRVAAWSMVSEPTRHAPYGWSHCLTMPQAVLGVADACTDRSAALAVAATYVAGFRTMADEPPRMTIDAPDPNVPLVEAIAAGPRVAAAAAWHAVEAGEAHDVITTLATAAAIHEDAHLVKYTLACMDAAADDPPARPLYLAAAATLAGWWAVADQAP